MLFFSRRLDKSKYGSSRGTTFCFTLKKKKGDAYENNVPRTVCNKFRTALDRYIYGNAQLMRLADNELLVCNFDINDHEEAVAYALRTINGVTNALTTKNKMNDAIYVVKAGIVANKDLFGDTESLIDYSQRTAMNAYDTSYHNRIEKTLRAKRSFGNETRNNRLCKITKEVILVFGTNRVVL